VTGRLHPQFAQAGVELRRTTAGPTPADVDPHRISQILTNLLRNALAATPAGGSVTVATRIAESTISVEVSDTGRGIAAADLHRIFARFERVPTGDEQYHPEQAGSGIGLTIARSLARAHGGELSAVSRSRSRGHDPHPASGS
jgi:histidine kinase